MYWIWYAPLCFRNWICIVKLKIFKRVALYQGIYIAPNFLFCWSSWFLSLEFAEYWLHSSKKKKRFILWYRKFYFFSKILVIQWSCALAQNWKCVKICKMILSCYDRSTANWPLCVFLPLKFETWEMYSPRSIQFC